MRLLFLLFFLCTNAFCDVVLIVLDSNAPINQQCRNYFKYSDPNPPGHVWQRLDQLLQRQGLSLEPSNLSELFNGNFQENIKNVKKIIFCNIPAWMPDWENKLSRIPKHKLILVTYEPPSVIPQMYYHNILSQFNHVITWNDDYVDNIKYFKFNYPVLTSLSPNLPSFHQRKLLTQISGNKTSDHRYELYSERRKVIDYFERLKISDFEFYGFGWDGSKYRNYRGSVQDKYEVLKKYRFSICYENIREIKGYITEKIFDCFATGTIPIYWGASNITKYIPKRCFIARDDFSSIHRLYSYLKNMREDDYNEYLHNIRLFLKSDRARQFSHETYAQILLERINCER